MDIQRLYQSLPSMNSWIAATLDAYRARARFVGGLALPRLPQYYSAQLLTSIRVIEVVELPVPPLTALGLPEFADYEGLTVAAITYPDAIFVHPDRVRDESAYFHELVHALQWRYLGRDKFLLAYGAGLALAGFYANPMETMAYELQAAFDKGRAPFDVAAEVGRRLDRIVPSLLERAAA